MTQDEPMYRAKSVTLKDIAARCGLGKSIVSYALRNEPCVKPETRARILAAAAELGYDPAAHESARRLVATRHQRKVLNHLIALALPGDFYQDIYFGEMFRGVMQVMRPAGFDVIILHPAPGDPEALMSSQSIRRGDVDGIIAFSPGDFDAADIEALRNHASFRKRPIISLVNPLPTCSNVLTDDVGGAYAAARHFLDLGHRHLLQFTCWGDTNLRRCRGVRAALTDAGLAPACNLHQVMTQESWLAYPGTEYHPRLRFEQDTARECESTLAQYLSEHREITAVLAWNDACARHIWHDLEDAGMHVPRDISLIGFDDTMPIPDRNGENLLTSVRLPLLEVGRDAAALLLEQLPQEEPSLSEIVLPTELMVRHSTAGHRA